jgi:hypothetical protein
MDELQRKVSELVERDVSRNADPAATFYKIRDVAYEARGDDGPSRSIPEISPLRLRPPRLTEAWFC